MSVVAAPRERYQVLGAIVAKSGSSPVKGGYGTLHQEDYGRLGLPDSLRYEPDRTKDAASPTYQQRGSLRLTVLSL